MPKGQKKKISLNVEMVENWQQILMYCTTTISFWKLDKEWPVNLIDDGIRNIIEDMEKELLEFRDIPF